MMASEMPAAVAPPGMSTDFKQNSDLWPSLIAVSVISLVIMTFAILIRLYAKGIKTKNMGWEEYLSTFSVIIIIAWTVIYDVSCHLGITKHQWNVKASEIPRIFNLLNICDILYGPMLGTAKFALLLQLRRHALLPTTPKNRMNWLIYPTGVVIFGYYFSCIFQFAFQCVPRRGLWDPSANPKCGNMPALTFAAAAFGLLTNLMLYALLVWLIIIASPNQLGGWLALGPINIVALFGIVTSITTVYYRIPFTDPSVDLTYHVAIVGIWAMAEYAAIILVGCIPSFGVWIGGKKVERHAEKVMEFETGSELLETKPAGAV
ncbi:hypothetical protein BKA66DRAFT_456148 [Pyrenochaeta sp. MPI-SDFR-AT-0127]|nr:hypothetical protein BKA66DRAFT_456148 [Pyrenochaeta sp. MPI-SDFR-AT-0127]